MKTIYIKNEEVDGDVDFWYYNAFINNKSNHNVFIETGGASDKNLKIKVRALYDMISCFKPNEYQFIPLFLMIRIPMKLVSFLIRK